MTGRRLTDARQKAAPGVAERRIVGLDVARGLAVLGMFAAHLLVFRRLSADPSTWGEVVEGRSAVLFGTLAGVSIALLSGRQRPAEGADLVRARVRIAVRAAWVFAIGFFLESLHTFVAVVLPVYAVVFVLALPFLRWPPRRLLLAAAVLAVVGPPLNVLLGQVAMRGGVAEDPFVRVLVTGKYPALVWWALVLVGLAVGRTDLRATGVRFRLAVAGAAAAVVGYAGGWLSTRLVAGDGPRLGPAAGFGAPPGVWRTAWLTGAEPHSGTTFEIIGSTGVALVVIAGCLVLAERLSRLTAPMAAVGSMALTVYTVQVLVIRVLLDVHPAAASGIRSWLVFVVVTLVAATAWRRTFGRGPLERLLTWSSGRAAAAVASRRPVGGLPSGAEAEEP